MDIKINFIYKFFFIFNRANSVLLGSWELGSVREPNFH